MDTTILRCKGCGANLIFDAQTQSWKCEQCGSTYSLDDLKKNTADSNINSNNQEITSIEQPNLTVYRCQSCGAEMVTDENTTATFCVYCHNPGIIKSRLEGKFRPDYIIPFKMSKEHALAAYNRLREGKYMTYKEFGDVNNIQKISGIYVPFWLYNGSATGYVSGTLSTSSSHRRGNYIVTNHKEYFEERVGEMDFKNVPTDGSIKFDDDTMDSIEPYDYTEMKDFDYSYLSGYLAEKYDVSNTQNEQRAKNRMENTVMYKINNTINGYLSNSKRETDIKIEDVKYALLPVWMLNTIVDGKTYTFAMNGQTGKIVGNIPLSTKMQIRYFIAIMLAAMAALSILTYFLFM